MNAICDLATLVAAIPDGAKLAIPNDPFGVSMAGTRELVALNGVRQGFDVASTDDIFTWTLIFLDAEVRGNAAARAQLATMERVSGGGDDFVVLRYNGPPAP